LVTRVSGQGSLGEILPKQLAQAPGPLGVGAGVVLSLGLIPNIPLFPFAVLAAVMGGAAYSLNQSEKEAEAEETERTRKQAEEAAPQPEGPEEMTQLLQIDLLELEVGYGLLHMVDPGQGGDLLDRIRSIRRQIALELGIVVPPVRIRDNLQLKPTEYLILIKGVDAAKGEIREGCYLAMNPGLAESDIEGVPTFEPAFGLEALWIKEEKREEAQVKGYTVVDPSTVIATHLTEIVKRNAFDLLGRQETQLLLDAVKAQAPALIDELTPNMLSLGAIQKVLQNLLRERISIRDLRTILETLADYATVAKDPELLTEYVRSALRRAISKQYQNPDGKLPVITLDHNFEETLTSGVQRTDYGSFLALEPGIAQKALHLLSQAAEAVGLMNEIPVVLVPPAIRLPLRKLTEKVLPGLVILSHNEVDGPIRTLKVVKLEG